MSDHLLTTKEVAHEFRVSEWTVRNWIAEGHIEHRRIGGTIRIPADEITKAAMKKAATVENTEAY